jgi:hypothetical protein
LAISKEVILNEFFDQFVTITKSKKSDLSKQEVQACLEQAIRAYAKHITTNSNDIDHVKEYLSAVKKDLCKVEEQHAKITRRAHRNAGISLGLGFLGCVG